MPIVRDVIDDWPQMAGRTDFEKQANALLTVRLLSLREAPDDECVSYVRRFEDRWDDNDLSENIALMSEDLRHAFGCFVERCTQAAELYARLRAGEDLIALSQLPYPTRH